MVESLTPESNVNVLNIWPVASMAVYINRPPHHVRFVAWGRADNGWWGCVTWQQPVTARGVHQEVGIAAWVRAGSLTQPQ